MGDPLRPETTSHRLRTEPPASCSRRRSDLLIEAVRAAVRGDVLVSPSIRVGLLRHFAPDGRNAGASMGSRPDGPSSCGALTDRERRCCGPGPGLGNARSPPALHSLTPETTSPPSIQLEPATCRLRRGRGARRMSEQSIPQTRAGQGPSVRRSRAASCSGTCWLHRKPWPYSPPSSRSVQLGDRLVPSAMTWTPTTRTRVRPPRWPRRRGRDEPVDETVDLRIRPGTLSRLSDE